jgi:hypothetical protein
MSNTRAVAHAKLEVKMAIAGVLVDLLQARLKMPLERGFTLSVLMEAVDRLTAEDEPAIEILCRATQEALKRADKAWSALHEEPDDVIPSEFYFVETVLRKTWWRFGWRTGRDVPDWVKNAALDNETEIRSALVAEGLSAFKSKWLHDPDLPLSRLLHPMLWWSREAGQLHNLD